MKEQCIVSKKRSFLCRVELSAKFIAKTYSQAPAFTKRCLIAGVIVALIQLINGSTLFTWFGNIIAILIMFPSLIFHDNGHENGERSSFGYYTKKGSFIGDDGHTYKSMNEAESAYYVNLEEKQRKKEEEEERLRDEYDTFHYDHYE